MSANGSTPDPTNGELAIMVDELQRRIEAREDSNEGMRVKVEAAEKRIAEHERMCASRWGELVGGMRMLKYGLGLILTGVSVVIALLALKGH